MTVEQKIEAVLTDLATLSEAPASNFEPRTSHGSSSSKVPNGVAERLNLHNVDHGEGREPSKERSLYDWWIWRFTKALSDGESEFDLYRLALIAERDYASRRFHSPDRMALRAGQLDDRDATDGGAAERAAAARVVDLYEGVSAVEVAVHEYATEAWVKKARRQLGRRPDDGRPRAAFLDWDEDRRHREVATLANRDIGLTKAAGRLGVDKNTVKRYWPQPAASAA